MNKKQIVGKLKDAVIVIAVAALFSVIQDTVVEKIKKVI